MASTEHSTVLHQLCNEQPLAVMATCAGNRPHASLIAFAASEDLLSFFFATPRNTRKGANLAQNGEVALLIDNRSNSIGDFSSGAAATVVGTAKELSGEARQSAASYYLSKHPHLKDFIAAPDCALFRVEASSISLVTRFQEVVRYDLG